MRIETKLNMNEYIETVNEIVDGFFDGGDYIPHVGTIATMQAFFNHCVKEHDYANPGEETGYKDLCDLAFADDAFLTAYNQAICENTAIALDFGNAYRDAMQIVNDRKSSYVRTATIISEVIEKYIDPDNLAEIFGTSNRFKNIINEDNVVSMEEMRSKE